VRLNPRVERGEAPSGGCGHPARRAFSPSARRLPASGGRGETSLAGEFSSEPRGATPSALREQNRRSAVGRSRRVALAVEGVVYYLHGDHLGSTVLTTDGEGRRVGEVRYAPYGATRWAWGSPSTAYRYTGQRWEGGVGLYDYRARWYEPTPGRFVQPDPIVPEPGKPQALNRYSYGMNNPLRFADPTGHQGVCVQGICVDPRQVDWQQGLILVEGLSVVAPEVGVVVVTGAGAVGTAYALGNLLIPWAMGDTGPAYPLPQEYEPGEIGATYPLAGTTTLRVADPYAYWHFAKPGSEIAAHLAMLLGESSVGGIPPHPGGQDPEGRDRKHNLEGLRNALKDVLRSMQRARKNAGPNLEQWLREGGWDEKAISDILEGLQDYARWMLDIDVEYFGVPVELAEEVANLLKQMGVMPYD